VLPTAHGQKVPPKNGLSNSHAPPQTNNTVVMNKSDSSIAEVLVNEYASNVDKQSKTSYGSEASVTRNHVGSNASTAPGNGTDSSMNFNGNGSCPAMCAPLSLQHFATVYYGPFLQKTPVKVSVCHQPFQSSVTFQLLNDGVFETFWPLERSVLNFNFCGMKRLGELLLSLDGM